MRHGLIAAGFGLAVVGGTAWDALAQGPRGGREAGFAPCTAPHRMRVVNLEMSPDPIPEGQSIRSFQVRINSSRDRECQSSIEVRDQKQRTVAKGTLGAIKPGANSYTVPALQGQKLEADEYCFKVLVDIAATPSASPAPQPPDVSGTFCARRPAGPVKGGWNLKDNKKI